MFEHFQQPLSKRHVFIKRVSKSTAVGLLIVFVSLFVGMLGYHHIGGLSWMDAYQEASMILSGMGPIATLKSDSGKFFAGTYALYSGLMLIVTVGVMVAPIVHRFFHKFHLDVDDKS